MKIPFFASFIIFMLVLSRAMRKQTRLMKESEKKFWDKEHAANHVRSKPLDSLDYIHIPFDALPMDTMTENPIVADCIHTLQNLSEQPIVNLTGYTNTQLKQTYGTANITALTSYDQNYTLLVCTLQKWADTLYASGYQEETRRILEFALQTHTDVSKTYYILAEIYQAQGEAFRIQELIKQAETIRSVSRKVIVRKLQESYPYNG